MKGVQGFPFSGERAKLNLALSSDAINESLPVARIAQSRVPKLYTPNPKLWAMRAYTFIC